MSINNSIADRRTFEWKTLSTLNTLPYQTEGDVNVKVGTSKGEASLVNRSFRKLVDNDLYNEQLVLNIKEGRNVPGATVTNLSQTILESEDGHKFALTSIADPHIIIGKRKIADNDDMVSCVPFFKGKQVNFCILDGRQYVVGTQDGIYCSGERYEGWHRAGEHGDDYFLDSFEGTNCKCCIHNDKMGQFENRLDDFEFFMGTNRGVWGFSLAYDYGDDVHWEILHNELLGTEINFLQLDKIEKCLFIGTNKGLFKSDGTTLIQEKKSYKYNVNTLARLDSEKEVRSNQRLLIGTPDGIFQSTNAYFPKSIVSMHDALKNLDVTCIGLTEDESTVEFLGTVGGLYKYTGKNSQPTPVNVCGETGRVWGVLYDNGYLYVSIGGNLYGRKSTDPDSAFVLVGGTGQVTRSADRHFREIYKFGKAVLVVCEDPNKTNYLYYVDTLDEPLEEIVLLREYKAEYGQINSITVHGDDAYVSSKNGIHIFKLITLYGHVLNKRCAIRKNTNLLFLQELSDNTFLVSVKDGNTIKNGILSEYLDSLTEIEGLPSDHLIAWANEIDDYVYIGLQKENGTVASDVNGLVKLNHEHLAVEAAMLPGTVVHGVAPNGSDHIYVLFEGNAANRNNIQMVSTNLEDDRTNVLGFTGEGPLAIYSMLDGERLIYGTKNILKCLSVRTEPSAPVFALEKINWLNKITVRDDDDFGIPFFAKTNEHSSYDLTGVVKMSPTTGELFGPELERNLVYKLWGDENKSLVATTNRALTYISYTGDAIRSIWADEADIPNRHLLVEEDFGYARTDGTFLISTLGQQTNLDIFQINDSGVLSTSRELGLDYLENVTRDPVIALEHLRRTSAGTGAIAIGKANEIQVLVPCPGIESLSNKVARQDILKRMGDEIAGKEMTFFDGDRNYFAINHQSNRCHTYTYNEDISDYGIAESSFTNKNEIVRDFATCRGKIMISSYVIDERMDEGTTDREYVRVFWEEITLAGLSGNNLGMYEYEENWENLFSGSSQISSWVCLNIGSLEGKKEGIDFLAKRHEHGQHDLSADSPSITIICPVFLLKDPSGNKHVFIDNDSGPTEMSFGSDETPIFLGIFNGCAIIATNKNIKYKIFNKDNLDSFTDFSSWNPIASGSSISDVNFIGNQMDIMGVAIVDKKAKRFVASINVFDDRQTFTTAIPWVTTDISFGSTTDFKHIYLQFQKIESQDKSYIMTSESMYGYHIASWAGPRIGYENAIFLVDYDGNIRRKVIERGTDLVGTNGRMPETELVSEDFLGTLNPSDDTLGIMQYGNISKNLPERVYIEIKGSGNIVAETKVVTFGYDLAKVAKVIQIPSGKTLQTLAVQAVPTLNGESENLIVAYTYGASDSRTDGIGYWISSPDGRTEKGNATSEWSGFAGSCDKIRDIFLSKSQFDENAYLMLLAEGNFYGGIGHFSILGYRVNSSADNIPLTDEDLGVICDDDIFVKNEHPIEVYGFIRGDFGEPRLITGPDTWEEDPLGYSACLLEWTGRYKTRIITFPLKTFDMTTSRNAIVTNFVSMQDSDDSLTVLAFNNVNKNEIWRADLVEDMGVSMSLQAGDVSPNEGVLVGNTNRILYLDNVGGRLYFVTDSAGDKSARSIDLNAVLNSHGGAEKFPVTYLEKVSGTKTNAAARMSRILATQDDKRDAIIFGAINGLYSWGEYIKIILNVDAGEKDKGMGGHIAWTNDPTIPSEEYYDVTHCAAWEVEKFNEDAGENESVTNYAFTFDITVYGIQFSFLSSNIDNLTMQTNNVCDGIFALEDGNYLLNFRDDMKVLDLEAEGLINLELEDLERMYASTNQDDDDTIYTLVPMTVSGKKSIYFMVNSTILAAFKDYGKFRCFERPTGDYKMLLKRFWNRDVREMFMLSNRDFLIGTTNGSFFVRNLEICTCYLDKYGKRLTGSDEAITYCHQDMSKGFAIKYLFCAGDKIYYTTDTINCGEEITTLPVETRIIYILAENDTMYDICTDKGLYITDLGYDIDDELHRFSIESVGALALEDMEPLLLGHIERNHRGDDFWVKLYKKAPAALAKVPAGFTSTAGLDLNNAVYLVENDVVSYVEFNDENKYIKASVSNWATKALQGDAIYSTGGYIDRLEMEDTGKVYDMSQLTYSCKFWESGLREFVIYVPTTMTFYMNNPQGYSNSEYAGKSIPRPNVSMNLNAANTMSKSYTSLRIILNNEHYKLKNISHIQINGNSLPLRIYKDSSFCQSGREDLFDGVIQPSVVVSMPSIDPSTNDSQRNIGSVENGLGSIVLEFAVYGSDAQSIRIIGNA